MSNLPETFEEASVRIAAYYEQLKAEGKSNVQAYNIAIGVYKKFMHKYKAKPGQKVSMCDKCMAPIIVADLYCAIADKGKVINRHALCHEGCLDE